jgi:hypothetical protein
MSRMYPEEIRKNRDVMGPILCKIGWKGVWYFEYFQDLLTLTRHIIHVTFILFNKYWLFLTRVDYYSAELQRCDGSDTVE